MGRGTPRRVTSVGRRAQASGQALPEVEAGERVTRMEKTETGRGGLGLTGGKQLRRRGLVCSVEVLRSLHPHCPGTHWGVTGAVCLNSALLPALRRDWLPGCWVRRPDRK